MESKRPPVEIPPEVETLRTLFQQAHNGLGLLPSQLSEVLKEELDINWPLKELRRFINNETKQPYRRLKIDIIRMTAMMKMILRVYDPDTLTIPLSASQRQLVDAGIIDMDRLKKVIARELTRQVVAKAKGPRRKGPKI